MPHERASCSRERGRTPLRQTPTALPRADSSCLVPSDPLAFQLPKGTVLRIVFASIGAHGHLYPVVPLALAARDLGHHAVVATSEQFHPGLKQAGLETVPSGGSLDDEFLFAMERQGGNREAAFGEVFGRVLPMQLVSDLEPVLATGDVNLVIHGLGSPGAAIAARIAGLPTAVVPFGRMLEGQLADTMLAAFQAICAEFGFPIADPRTMDSPYIDICPPSLQVPGFADHVGVLHTRFTPWNPPGDLPAALVGRDDTRPLVYATLGTVFADAGIMRKVIDGLAALPVDVLVAAGPKISTAELGGIPGNVTVQNWVPQAEVLPYVDAIVHHGGSGTALGAAAHAIPQLIVPVGADQSTNADELVRVGCGVRLSPQDLDGGAIADHVHAILSDSAVGESARRLAAEIAMLPPPADTVTHLVRTLVHGTAQPES